MAKQYTIIGLIKGGGAELVVRWIEERSTAEVINNHFVQRAGPRNDRFLKNAAIVIPGHIDNPVFINGQEQRSRKRPGLDDGEDAIPAVHRGRKPTKVAKTPRRGRKTARQLAAEEMAEIVERTTRKGRKPTRKAGNTEYAEGLNHPVPKVRGKGKTKESNKPQGPTAVPSAPDYLEQARERRETEQERIVNLRNLA